MLNTDTLTLPHPTEPVKAFADIDDTLITAQQDDALGRTLADLTPAQRWAFHTFGRKAAKSVGADKIAGCGFPYDAAGRSVYYKLRGDPGVKPHHSLEQNGVRHCASLSHCWDWCSPFRRSLLAKLIQPGIKIYSQDRSLAFGTFTAWHSPQQSLYQVLSIIAFGWRRFTKTREWKMLKERFGVCGRLRVLEWLFGVEGWHPHYHILWLFDRFLSQQEIEEFGYEVGKLYIKGVKDAGGYASPLAQHIRSVDEGGALYLAKVAGDNQPSSWGAPQELALAHRKSSRSGSLSQVALQISAVLDKHPQHTAAYYEQLETTQGLHVVNAVAGTWGLLAGLPQDTAAKLAKAVLAGNADDACAAVYGAIRRSILLAQHDWHQTVAIQTSELGARDRHIFREAQKLIANGKGIEDKLALITAAYNELTQLIPAKPNTTN